MSVTAWLAVSVFDWCQANRSQEEENINGAILEERGDNGVGSICFNFCPGLRISSRRGMENNGAKRIETRNLIIQDF